MGKGGPPLQLVEMGEEGQRAILESIEQGAWDWVAAGAGGISPKTFATWKERWRDIEERLSENPDAPLTPNEKIILEFMRKVQVVSRKARMRCEKAVARDNPTVYLRNGPGKTYGKDEPGWTEDVLKIDATVNLTVSGDATRTLLEKSKKKK